MVEGGMEQRIDQHMDSLAELRLYPVFELEIDEVFEILAKRSHLKDRNYGRIEGEYKKSLQDIYDSLMHGVPWFEFREEYAVVTTELVFVPPVVGFDLKNEQKAFARLFKSKYRLQNPFQAHFEVRGEYSEDSEDRVGLDAIVNSIKKQQFIGHDVSRSLERTMYEEGRLAVGKLFKDYSRDNHLSALAHLFMVFPTFGLDPAHGDLQADYTRAIKGKPEYVLILPLEWKDPEE